MDNEATKLEIQISGDQPFKPGDRINGEVIMTTTKPLKDISGVKIKFEGGSWNAEPGGRIEREVYVDESISLPVDEGQLKMPGTTHRFAFSFDVPEGCKSSTVFSRFGWTKYSIVASLQRNGVDLCSASRNLTILAPPTEPTDEAKSNGAAVERINNHDTTPTADEDDDDDDESDVDDIVGLLQGLSLSNRVESSWVSAEGSLRLSADGHHNKRAEMKLRLPKRILKPGEFIPISGTFLLSSSCAGPFKIKASLGFSVGRTIPFSSTSEAVDGKRCEDSSPVAQEVEHPQIIQGHQTITWQNEEFFRLPSTIPTESSLFHRFRNRRRLVIAMEQCSSLGKPKRLQVELPI